MFKDKNFIGNNTDIIEITSGMSTSLLLDRSGIDNIKVNLPFQFDIGNLKEMEQFKRTELKKIVDIIDLKDSFHKEDANFDFKEEFDKLNEYVNNAKKIRVWSSLFDADEYCVLLFICHHFKDKDISVVFSNGVRYSAIVTAQNGEEDIKELAKREITLKDYQKEWFDKEWVDIINSNSELRFMINGHIISKDIDYFDKDIISRLESHGKIGKIKFICDLIGNPIIPGLYYADLVYNYLIDRLINKGLITRTIEDSKEIIEVSK